MKKVNLIREIFVWSTVVVINCFGEDKKTLEKGFLAVEKRFHEIDQIFSTFRNDSEISLFNRGLINQSQMSGNFKRIWNLNVKAKELTNGCFDPWWQGTYDPIGIVKGWAADCAIEILKEIGVSSVQVNTAGDISLFGGYPTEGEIRPWKIGIRDPRNPKVIVKVIERFDGSVATSGTYEKGAHIWDPRTGLVAIGALSATVVGPNGGLAEALATGLIVAGREGSTWFEKPELSDYGAWVIDRHTETAWSVGKI